MTSQTLIACAFLMVSFVFGNTQKDRDDTASVKDVEQRLEAALSKNDTAALDQILATGYVEINSQGEHIEKAQVLALSRARKAAPASQSVGPEKKVEDQQIRLHGNAALVMTLISTKHLFQDYQTAGPPPAQGPELVDRERRLRVYARTGSGWQLAAQQTTAIPHRAPQPVGPQKF